MNSINTQPQPEDLLIANGQQTAELLRHLADNEIDSDYFAVTSECESYGKETDAELSITEFALQAAGCVDALVEALSKAQKMATQQGRMACELFDEVNQLRRTADDKAPELRAQLIEADCDLEALRQRIADLESRTVTVSLPAEYFNSDGSVNADMTNTCPVISAHREAHRAAGIGIVYSHR